MKDKYKSFFFKKNLIKAISLAYKTNMQVKVTL